MHSLCSYPVSSIRSVLDYLTGLLHLRTYMYLYLTLAWYVTRQIGNDLHEPFVFWLDRLQSYGCQSPPSARVRVRVSGYLSCRLFGRSSRPQRLFQHVRVYTFEYSCSCVLT